MHMSTHKRGSQHKEFAQEPVLHKLCTTCEGECLDDQHTRGNTNWTRCVLFSVLGPQRFCYTEASYKDVQSTYIQYVST